MLRRAAPNTRLSILALKYLSLSPFASPSRKISHSVPWLGSNITTTALDNNRQPAGRAGSAANPNDIIMDTSFCSEFSSVCSSSPVKKEESPVKPNPEFSVTSSIIECIHNTGWSSLFEETQEDAKSEIDDSWFSEGDTYDVDMVLQLAKVKQPAAVAADSVASILLKSLSEAGSVLALALAQALVLESFEAQLPMKITRVSKSDEEPSPKRMKPSSAANTSPTRPVLPSTPSPKKTINKEIFVLGASRSAIQQKCSNSASALPVKMPYTSPKVLVSPTKQTTTSHIYSPLKIPTNVHSMRCFSTSVAVKAPNIKIDNHTILLSTQKAPASQSNSDPTSKCVKPIVLSKEQEHILQLANYGTSLFYTGSAGTGKSILLKEIIKSLRKRHESGSVAVTASTGLAACNIGGTTLHSFAGVGLGDMDLQKCFTKVKRNKVAYKRWLRVKVLVVDEISMIDGLFLNKLNELAKKIRKNNLPFGGIQLIVSGDFYQLPPVIKKSVREELSGATTTANESSFAFESEAWRETIQCTMILKEVFRQKNDNDFVNMLNEMRTGNVSMANQKKFQFLSRELSSKDGIEPAELFPTRLEVDLANNQRLAALSGNALVFQCADSGELLHQQRVQILNNSLAASKLFLKKNAQVMCIKNFDETLVNGSLGQVVDFMDRNTYMAYDAMKENGCGSASIETTEEIVESVLKEEEKLRKTKLDIPFESEEELKAFTPLDNSIFDFIQQVPLPEDEEIQSQFIINQRRKIDLLNKLHETSHTRRYPVVRFTGPDGHNTREVLVEPEEWTVEDENGVVLARRIQLPLILAWSLSIHKSQGQTLSKVKVDLKKIFEKGQAYVALSRATSRRGLQVLNFRTDKVMVHEKVNRFYETLMTAEEMQKKQAESASLGETDNGFVPIRIENTKRTKRIHDYMSR